MSRLTDLLSLRNQRVCPRWMCFTFDNALRRLIQNPENIVNPYLREGQIALDIGAGIGYFTIPMAKRVGEKGRVIAADIQESMLKGIAKRADRAGVTDRIILRLSTDESLNVGGQFDFILVFWMAHEAKNLKTFFRQLRAHLKKGGRLLVAEPRIHLSRKKFDEEVKMARLAGLLLIDQPKISLSHAALFTK